MTNVIDWLIAPLQYAFMVRGLLAAAAINCGYYAISQMPLTTVTVLFFTAPLFITLFAVPFLGEQVGWRRWSGILFGFAGAIVIIQPGADTFQPAALLPMLAAFCYGVSTVLGRKIGITESGSVMAFYMMLTFFYMGVGLGVGVAHLGLPVPEAGPMRFMLQPWHMPTGVELGMIVMVGIISGAGFWMLATAYRVARAPVVAPFEYTAMLWVSILSYLLWGEIPKLTTVIGTLMIIASGVYVLRREAIVRERPLAGKGVWRSRN